MTGTWRYPVLFSGKGLPTTSHLLGFSHLIEKNTIKDANDHTLIALSFNNV
jgi:hypothetical protein